MTTWPQPFDLAATLTCGQCFRWKRNADGSFSGVAGGRMLTVSPQSPGDALGDPFWRRYFDLESDYAAICAGLAAQNPVLAAALAETPGVRILRQDPWEALCTFILSQNNNIPRITGIVERLCDCFGDPLPGGGRSFPGPERLAACSVEDLAPLRCGFRASYVLDAARRVAGGLSLEEIGRLPLAQAREALRQIRGVGPKVAECALLYGLHRLDAFPVDVWMNRAMASFFPGVQPETFGPYAGVAQQALFVYSRNHPDQVREPARRAAKSRKR